MHLSLCNTRVKDEYSKSESIEITYLNCEIKMLLDRYHLVEARNEIEVVVKIPFRLGQISKKQPSTVRDNQELTSQLGACHDNNSLFSSNERFLGYLTFFLSCSFHTPKQQYDHSAKL